MGYRVEQELTLPSEIHEHDIRDEVLNAFLSFGPDESRKGLLLAELILVGGRYGGQWKVSAVHSSAPDQSLGSMWCDENTKREAVIPTADTWIRESEASAWIPGTAIELPLPENYAPYCAQAIILARGHDIPDEMFAQASE